MATGTVVVQLAVPQRHRRLDTLDGEAPRPGHDERLVVQAPAALAVQLVGVRDHHLTDAGVLQHQLVRLDHALDGLVQVALRIGALGPGPLPHGQPDHPGRGVRGTRGHPVAARHVVGAGRQGRRGADEPDATDAVGQRPATGEGIGAAARPAEHRELVDAQAVRQLLHVPGPVQQPPAGCPGRQADAGAVDRDEPDAQLPGRWSSG